MSEISAHDFRSHLRNAVAEEREQGTLYVRQNKSLMEQIERSLKTLREGTGYLPSLEELDALDAPQALDTLVSVEF